MKLETISAPLLVADAGDKPWNRSEPKAQVSELPSFKLGLIIWWQAQVIHIVFLARLLTLTASSSASTAVADRLNLKKLNYLTFSILSTHLTVWTTSYSMYVGGHLYMERDSGNVIVLSLLSF
ncbi:hypothetical protein BCR26_13740 [Enterococcus rivorum]|uniref:Uncharacterized protein n=1 Tax=Enterococcus rivorum TaxID=762845 RepID=A0A1E5KWJ5_9ENTE|nr:hypothetical protein BCR26_13740 [Enterococcus rivorum]